MKDYEGDIKIVYKHFVVHPGSATIPATASCAAAKQGKFGEFEELVWKEGFPKMRQDGLKQETMNKFANQLGLDMGKFATDQKECAGIVRKDQQQLQKVGTSGTPAFYINGRFLSGARPVDQFKKIIDEELKKANQRIQSGTKLEDYYNEWVVKKGKKSL
jgi:protein-disulfide isomerase